MTVRQDHETKDLYFAAFLQARGVELINTRRRGSVVWFVFEDVDNMRDLRHDFFSGTGKVKARPYADALRNLKSLIHEV